MNEYKTKHAIGDLVYTASANGYDRDVIKAIKITSLKEDVKYGIERDVTGTYWMFGSSDGYSWYASSEIFSDKESAVARYENLKLTKELEEKKEEAERKKERKEDLLEQLRELEEE